MSLPRPVAALWDELEAARRDVLREVQGVSQRQADWKPRDGEWSIGEIVDHLSIAEIATGKLTTKLTKEVGSGSVPGAFPHDLTQFAALPVDPAEAAQAPAVVWPEPGKPIVELLARMKATRERSRQSVEKLATCDPRTLVFKHFRLGDLDLAQWWRLQAAHDGIHLAQIRAVKAAPGFPAA